MRQVKILLAALGAVSVLAGCSSVSLDETAKDGTLAPEAQATQPAEAVNPFLDPQNPLSKRSIYFGFDAYDVSSDYMGIVEAHARWLLDHPEVKIVIQGNTDERGGREYNLALGQKRSEAVKQRLMLLGVPAERIEAVSFGKEKPVATGSTEEAWAQNRRADIVYPSSVTAARQPASAAAQP